MNRQIQLFGGLWGVAALALLGMTAVSCDSKVPDTGLGAAVASTTAGSASSASQTAGSGTADDNNTGGSDSKTGQTADSKSGTSKLTTPTAAEAAKIDPDTIATIKTNLGTIVIRFFKDKAPITTASFVQLAKSGFYDGTKFHRVIPGFMIQGGDPNSKGDDRSIMGTGGPGYSVPAEFNDVDFQRGIVGLARSSDPNSGGSQFYIMVANSPHLNGQYTAFGQVLSGMDVADKIVKLPRDANDNPNASNPAIIEKVTISKGDESKFPKIPLIQK